MWASQSACRAIAATSNASFCGRNWNALYGRCPATKIAADVRRRTWVQTLRLLTSAAAAASMFPELKCLIAFPPEIRRHAQHIAHQENHLEKEIVHNGYPGKDQIQQEQAVTGEFIKSRAGCVRHPGGN